MEQANRKALDADAAAERYLQTACILILSVSTLLPSSHLLSIETRQSQLCRSLTCLCHVSRPAASQLYYVIV